MKNEIDDKDLLSQIKAMNMTELHAMLLTLRIVSLFCTISGVSAIVLALAIPDLIFIAISFMILSFVGNFAVTTDNIIAFVKHTIKAKQKS